MTGQKSLVKSITLIMSYVKTKSRERIILWLELLKEMK